MRITLDIRLFVHNIAVRRNIYVYEESILEYTFSFVLFVLEIQLVSRITIFFILSHRFAVC